MADEVDALAQPRARPTVTNKPPSWPSVRIQPIWASHALDCQLSAGGGEQFVRLVAISRARIGPQVLDVVFGEPPLHFGERVAMLLGMLILVAQPRLAPRGLGRRSRRTGSNGMNAIAGQPRDRAPHAQRQRAR